ncbi:ExeA family protein [Psychromarinibacter sp. S121]|uniref:ExeA family protein n=1 Tax=Psychromarinibacter sp. S121 TaxID=3415127 RepID=UPI003C7C0401
MARIKLYTDFFKFEDNPFTLVPDPEYLYWSPQHREAFAIFEFGIMSLAPITLLTGEIGAGKTTLIQAMLPKLDSDVTVGLVSNAQGDRGELLQWILYSLGEDFRADAGHVQTFERLQEVILREYAAGRRIVLIFDEAQNLSEDGLEELRMLTNLNSRKDVLVQLVLVGQPELREMVNRPGMHQLLQRVAASYHLKKLEKRYAADYIRHRVRIAGGTGDEFSDCACDAIYDATKGVPRLVNQLCEFTLLYAWAGKVKRVDASTVGDVLADGVFFRGHDPDLDPSVASLKLRTSYPGTSPVV